MSVRRSWLGFPASKAWRHGSPPGKVTLNLTSMMDMFTILLVFLLRAYSLEGQLVQPSDYLTLPKSTADQPPELALELVVSKEWVMLNHKPVARVADIQKQEGLIIPELLAELDVHAREAKKMESLYGTPFTGKITIQGDRDLPYQTLVKVMATCGRAEFGNMRLVVYQREG
ncbi:MAG: biopolymer transporter ExbD [candidate division KSB1 bacterium]|nr:biopolymer transporter ExbD [candidate division KSB1 bacterium]